MVAALEKKKMLEDSIIVITTDNGGPAAGFNQNAASNWPLRGVKDTLWEGGVRGAGEITTGCSKKRVMCDYRVFQKTFDVRFLTPKMLPLALALIKTKNRHLFDQLVKNLPFSMENSLQASKTLNSHVK